MRYLKIVQTVQCSLYSLYTVQYMLYTSVQCDMLAVHYVLAVRTFVRCAM